MIRGADAFWRAIDLAAGAVPTFHRSRVFGLRMPWATILLLLIVGILALTYQFESDFGSSRTRSVAYTLGPLMGAMLLLPAFFAMTRRLALLARPEAIQLVPGLRVDATFTLIANALLLSLLLTAILSSVWLKGSQFIVALIPILLFGLASDLPVGRLRSVLWLLIVPAALCAIWLGAIMGMAFRPTDSLGYKIELAWGLCMIFATVLGMVGLVYVKPLATIGLGTIWIWLLWDPFALLGLNFNTVLGVTYEMFTQAGTHTLTAVAAFSALWYWLIGRRGDKAFAQRAAEGKVEEAFSGAPDLSRMAPSTWLLVPYRRALQRTLALRGTVDRTEQARRHLALALGPSLHWITLPPIAVAMGLIWMAFLFAMPAHIRTTFAATEFTGAALIAVVVILEFAIQQYGKRKAEVDLLSLAPRALSEHHLRAALARHAASFVGTGIGMLALVVWVPRLSFGGQVEDPIKAVSDLLSLLIIGVCAFSLLLRHLLPAGPISGDVGFFARAAIVLLAIMPLAISGATRLSAESQLLVQSFLLLGWGIYAWWECRRLIRARPAG